VVTLELVVSPLNSGAETVSVKLKKEVTVPDRSPVKLPNPNVLSPAANGSAFAVNVTWDGVHLTFILLQSEGESSSNKPNGLLVGLVGDKSAMSVASKLNVTDVIDVVEEGVARLKVNKKSFGEGPFPSKHCAITPPLVVLPQEVSENPGPDVSP